MFLFQSSAKIMIRGKGSIKEGKIHNVRSNNCYFFLYMLALALERSDLSDLGVSSNLIGLLSQCNLALFPPWSKSCMIQTKQNGDQLN